MDGYRTWIFCRFLYCRILPVLVFVYWFIFLVLPCRAWLGFAAFTRLPWIAAVDKRMDCTGR